MYTIDSKKLAQVVEIFNEQVDPKATTEIIRSEICSDRHVDGGHQQWIDDATPQTIADWLALFYSY